MHHPAPLTRTLSATALLLAVMMSVLACGGGGTASTPPGASVATTTKPAGSVAAPSAEAASPAASPVAGGGSGGLACDLLTAAEASGVIGGGSLTTASTPGEPSYCSYNAGDGSAKVVTSYVQKDAKVGYDAWAGASDSVKVAGIGDGAVWVPSLATLLIIKGDRVVGITAGSGADDETQRIDWSKALGAIAAGRL